MTVKKSFINVTCAPDFIFFDGKKIERIWMIFDIEN